MGFHHRRLINTMQPETVLLLRYLRQIGGGVSDNSAGRIDDFIARLKRAGIWEDLDGLYVFAQENSVAALVNWKNPGTYNATATNSPTFTANVGFAGNGTNSFIDTNFNPTTAVAPKYTLNDACRFGRIITPPSADVVWGDTSAFRNNFYMNAAGTTDIRINCGDSGTNIAVTDASPAGFWSGVRTTSAAQALFKNGVSVGSNTTASSAMSNANLSVFRTQSDYGASTQASHGWGRQLSADKQQRLADIEATYMRSVGAI